MAYVPTILGPKNGINLQLAQILDQAPQPFQSFTTAEAAAETYIGKAIGLCASATTTCDFRSAYGNNYGAPWTQLSINISSSEVVTYPGDGHGFERRTTTRSAASWRTRFPR